MNLNIILVIYNLKCNNSTTLNTISNCKNERHNIFVCDNSTDAIIKNDNESYCIDNGIHYIDMNRNAGLSRAYNRALKEIDDDSWVIIFDQDTQIPDGYFKELRKSINNYPQIKMHVPVVRSNFMQMSPCRLKKYRVKKIKSISAGIYSDITAINSGMAIKKDVFEITGGYNEKIFLDYLDHHFVKQFRKYYKEIAVFNCTIIQEFSDEDHSDFPRDLKRFRIYSNDFYEFCKDSMEGRVYYYVKLSYRAAKLSLLHKKFDFFKIALERRKE